MLSIRLARHLAGGNFLYCAQPSSAILCIYDSWSLCIFICDIQARRKGQESNRIAHISYAASKAAAARKQTECVIVSSEERAGDDDRGRVCWSLMPAPNAVNLTCHSNNLRANFHAI